ncbi:MAG TPA: CDP-alcohol phosphatidyltransferase family protein [Candidatus Binataceae bacterium]|nr:CDP-alcohol phosphatidyltransferase family protein [Candidatus Binataceae bacterium]
MVETALIYAHRRAGEAVFGRSLLERNLRLCARAGIRRFFIACNGSAPEEVRAALGSFGDRDAVALLDSSDSGCRSRHGLVDSAPCVALDGNLIFTADQLSRVIAQYEGGAARVVRLASTGGDFDAGLAVGTVADLLNPPPIQGAAPSLAGLLPFALDGRADDPLEAERRIGVTLRHETAWKDGFLARHIDRRISWRFALALARTGVTANQVTLANTALGLIAAAMIALGGYWPPLLGTIMLLLAITIDGVDGELARMKLSQSDFGASLDAVTDTIVNFAMFAGIASAAYRVGGSLYLKLFGFFLIGCALSAAASYWVYRKDSAESRSLLEKLTSRDFVYALIPFALIGRMDLMMWVATIGSFVFPIFLWAITRRRPLAS